jgi:hypothetical protein
MPGETFMLIVFQRQLFGSYLQLARRGRLLATGTRGATASSSSDQVSHPTQSYSNLSPKRGPRAPLFRVPYDHTF